MLVSSFSTEVVAAPERFELFTEITDRSQCPTGCAAVIQGDFRARMRVLDLGNYRSRRCRFPHLEITRTAKLIRQSDSEAYQINYFLQGGGSSPLAGDDTALRAGDLVVMDSSRPYRGDVLAVRDGWSHVTVQFPRGLMPLPERTVRHLLGVRIDGRRGMGGLFARWLADLHARAGEFAPADASTLASVTLDLLASVCAHCLEAEDALSPQARRNALRARISAFVEEHLADPALTPRAVADAHHISLRHLQQLLAEHGTSPAAWIRHRRLERCRLDLTDPRLDARPVQAVAGTLGLHRPRPLQPPVPCRLRHIPAGLQEPAAQARSGGAYRVVSNEHRGSRGRCPVRDAGTAVCGRPGWTRATGSVAAGGQGRGPRALAACPPGWCVRPWRAGPPAAPPSARRTPAAGGPRGSGWRSRAGTPRTPR